MSSKFKWSCSLRAGASVALALVLVGCLSGCVDQAQQHADRAITDYIMGGYPEAVSRLLPLSTKTNENFVLNNCRLGSAALAEYDLDTAEGAFLRAYEVINSVGVNDGGRSLGAALVDEKIKIWKGEPFERAMANFYLGLIYYMRHDYENARAAFENALFKLRDYGEGDVKSDEYRQVESNFVLAYIMLGRCQQRLDKPDLAAKSFERAIQLHPYLNGLADAQLNADSNLLLVVDFGYGPRKVANSDGAIVGFSPKPSMAGPIPFPAVFVDSQPVNLERTNRPPVDLLALAQDRRWESIDTLRSIKSFVGTGLIAGGAVAGLSSRGGDPALALGLIAGGLLLKATSQADTRQWEMLPRCTFVLPLKVSPGTHDITVDFPNISGVRQHWQGLVVPAQGEATYYFRMQRFVEGPFTWPPPAMTHGSADGASNPPAPAH